MQQWNRKARGGWFRVAIVFALASFAPMGSGVTFADGLPDVAGRDLEKYQGHFEFGFRPGTDRLLGEAEMMIPVWQGERTLVFFDAIGRFDDEDSREGNFGFGVRRMLGNRAVVGGYAFYDLRSTPTGNRFRQGTLGFDLLTTELDFRFNVYLPEATQRDVAGTASASVRSAGSGFRITSQGETRERALPGFDVEVGGRLPLRNRDVRLYVAGFRFAADDYEDVTGMRTRLETTLVDLPFLGYGSELVLGIEGQWDTVRHSDARAVTRLRIPFGRFRGPRTRPTSRELTRLERRMTARVVRDVDVIASQREAPVVDELAQIAINGRRFDGFDATLGAGAALTADVAAAGVGALILVDGSGGTLTTNTRVDLQPDQTLVGGGTALTLVGAQTGRMMGTLAPGVRPTVLGTAGNREIFRTANGVWLEGLDLRGGRDALDVRASSGVNLRDLSIVNTGRRGVLVRTGSSNVLFSNVRIGNTANEGIRVTNATDVTLDGVHVSGAGGSAGVRIQNATNTIFRNGSVAGTAQRGIWVRNATGTLLGNLTVSATGNDGIRVQGGTNTVLDGVSVFGAGGSAGLRIHATNALVFRNGTITGSNARGIRFSGTSNGISGAANAVTGNGLQDCFNGGTVNAGTLTLNAGTPCP